MAVVSDDHADERFNVEAYQLSSSSQPTLRLFSPDEVEEHNNNSNSSNNSNNNSNNRSFWACIDGFVVDATDFVRKHPGGKKKLLATNDATTGDRGIPYDFSFSRGKNAHFPATAKIFKDGIQRFLNGGSPEICFPAVYKGEDKGGTLIVLGRLQR